VGRNVGAGGKKVGVTTGGGEGATGADGAACGAVALEGGSTGDDGAVAMGAVAFVDDGEAIGVVMGGATGVAGADGTTGALALAGDATGDVALVGAIGDDGAACGGETLEGGATGDDGAVIGADVDVVLVELVLVELVELVAFSCRKRPDHCIDCSYPSLPLRMSDANKAEIKTFIV
jgi:hypothetical protein